MRKIATTVPDALADQIEAAARADQRSVRAWLRLLLIGVLKSPRKSK
jgi:hypothetical protein